MRLDVERLGKPEPEGVAGNLDRAEARQMLGRELRIEQSESTAP